MAWWLHERVHHASKTCSQSKFTTFQWSRPSYASQTCSLHSKYGRWMKHLIVPCWNIINTNSADANFHALNPPIHCVGPRIACFFIVARKWNQHRKVRLLVSSKTRVYTLISVSFCSNTKNSIRACFRKIRVQYYTSDNSCCIHKLRLNMWSASNGRLDREGHFVGLLWVLSFVTRITHFWTVPSRVRSSQFRWWDSKITF